MFMPCCDEETSSLREGVFVLTGLLVGSLPYAVTGVTTSSSLTTSSVPYAGTCLHRARLLAHADYGKALTPSGFEGRWQCRLLAVHVSSYCTATSARTLVHVAQSVPQLHAVPNVRFFLTLTCHQDDTGVSGRRVSFKIS